MLILVTGATGKVGRNLISSACSSDDALRRRAGSAPSATTACSTRPTASRSCRGSIADRDAVATAMAGRHPCRSSRDLQGDAGRGDGRHGQGSLLAARGIPQQRHCAAVHPDRRRRRRRPLPLSPRRPDHRSHAAYGLSRLLRAVEGARGGDARAVRHPVRHQWLLPARALDHGEGRLQIHPVLRRRRLRRAGLEGRWCPRPTPKGYYQAGTVPLLRDADGEPLKRNFVHVDDLCAAILAALDNPRAERQLFNICMDRPVDYGEVAAYLKRTRGLDSIDIPSRFHSNWMDNAKAQISSRLAARIRSAEAHRLGLDLRAIAQRSPAGSGIRVDLQWPGS